MVARSGEEGLEFATGQAPDLVVLDVRLPGIDGFEVLRRLRAAGSKAPVLVLTARDDEVDKVIGLELGADDYLTKPFGLRELMSRIKALLRRAYGDLADAAGGRVIRHRDLLIDLERRRVQRGAQADQPDRDRVRDPAPPREPTRPGLLAARAARAPARLRGARPGREDDQRPRQPPAREDRGRPVEPRVRADRQGCRLRLRRALTRRRRPRPAGPVPDQRPLRRIMPRTFQGRLTLGFISVVSLTLLLVGPAVIIQLDDYFLRQEQTNLESPGELDDRGRRAVREPDRSMARCVTPDNTLTDAAGVLHRVEHAGRSPTTPRPT